MDWKLENVPELSGYTVEWAEEANYYLSRRNVIYHAENLSGNFREVAVIAAPAWKSLASFSRLAQRLLRFQVTNVVPMADGGIFVTFDKTVGIIRQGGYTELAGLARPCRVLRAACARDAGGDIFFGEYLANDERGEMRIYRYPAGGAKIETVYTFPAGSIKHIHGIYFDDAGGALYCLTGDNENECRIMRSFDAFATLETVGEGDETWRAVSILFTGEAFFYGMDAEYRSNHIFRVDRKSGERSSLGEVSGTVFYSKIVDGELFFTTTAENAPSQTENVAGLWRIGGNGECEQVAAFPKDFWHPTLFQFGTIHFPYVNSISGELYFHLVGVKGDNNTFRLRKLL